MPSKKSYRNKSKRSNRRRIKGGNESCPFIKGGSSLNQAINENSAVIPHNQSIGTSSDPYDSNNLLSTRMLPNIKGGKRRRTMSKRKTTSKRRYKHSKTNKKLRGGNPDPSAANAISSFGTTTGLSHMYNVLSGTSSVDSNPLNQPANNPYTNALV